MDAFVTRDYYETSYLGASVPSAGFAQLAIQASYEVDAITFRRASATIEAGTSLSLITDIQMATCAVMDALYQYSQQMAGVLGTIASEKVGDYARSFVVASDAAMSQKELVFKAVDRYLSTTGLMCGWA